jgi:hypothetical protein
MVALLEGCTLTYLVVEGISSASDHDIVRGQVGSLQYRNAANIQLVTDSLVISGTMVGVEAMDSTTYCVKWSVWAREAGLDLQPGDSVKAIRHEPFLGDVSGRLCGISEGALHLQSGGEPRSIAVNKIARLNTERVAWSGKEFLRIVSDNPPPAMMCLSVLTEDARKVMIPVDEVRGGEYQRHFNGWPLILTVPFDAAMTIMIIEGFSSAFEGMRFM